MVDFSNLKAYEPTDMVAYRLTQLQGSCSLNLRPATEANPKYFAAFMKRNAQYAKSNRRVTVTQALINDTRDSDKDLFATHVIVGWSGITDINGETVPFTPQNVRQFLDAIPDWIFDDIRAFASDPSNFVSLEDGDESAIAGNS